ncbi:hypothetical protein QUF74_05610 [Candidatus Halobeggiatoa sp. HSG11]|nr:hypothetical protein [Candidatus Halobeggiatoa sp. HSG11]
MNNIEYHLRRLFSPCEDTSLYSNVLKSMVGDYKFAVFASAELVNNNLQNLVTKNFGEFHIENYSDIYTDENPMVTFGKNFLSLPSNSMILYDNRTVIHGDKKKESIIVDLYSGLGFINPQILTYLVLLPTKNGKMRGFWLTVIKNGGEFTMKQKENMGRFGSNISSIANASFNNDGHYKEMIHLSHECELTSAETRVLFNIYLDVNNFPAQFSLERLYLTCGGIDNIKVGKTNMSRFVNNIARKIAGEKVKDAKSFLTYITTTLDKPNRYNIL